jgi:hypothetical protein
MALIASVLAAAAPVSHRACTPDPALSHPQACPPAAVNADHFHLMPTADRRPAVGGHPLACQPSRYPSARPGMTHCDEQSMRRQIKSTHIG